jgi:hypothetical protein
MDHKTTVIEALARAETILRSVRWNLLAGRLTLHAVGVEVDYVASDLALLSSLARRAETQALRTCHCHRCSGECMECQEGGRPCAVCDEHFATLANEGRTDARENGSGSEGGAC